MHRSSSSMGVPHEPIYSRSVFEAILGGLGSDSSFKGDVECDDRGVWVKHDVRIGPLAWHPVCEIMALGSPNPLDEPWLPFPFTARQLAAFLTDGWGYFIQEKYGEWADGPSEEELRSLGTLGGKAKESLIAAYEAYRQAVELAPRRDVTLETTAAALLGEYRAAREAALALERVREPGISDGEYTRRVARVNGAVAELSQQEVAARLSADAAYKAWRKAVVQHLLLPVDQVPTEAFESSILRALPVSRRAEAIYRLRLQQEFDDSEEGRAQWGLICKKYDTELELRTWNLRRAEGVIEADIRDRKLHDLNAQLAQLNALIDGAEVAGVSPVGHAPGSQESVDERCRRRLLDLRRFGGDWVRCESGWGAKERKTGAFGKLVDQEKAGGVSNHSPKSVRRDLNVAAEAEAAEKRAGLALRLPDRP